MRTCRVILYSCVRDRRRRYDFVQSSPIVARFLEILWIGPCRSSFSTPLLALSHVLLYTVSQHAIRSHTSKLGFAFRSSSTSICSKANQWQQWHGILRTHRTKILQTHLFSTFCNSQKFVFFDGSFIGVDACAARCECRQIQKAKSKAETPWMQTTKTISQWKKQQWQTKN